MTQVRDGKQLTIETSEIIGRMCFYEHDERRISDVESKGEVKGKERGHMKDALALGGDEGRDKLR